MCCALFEMSARQFLATASALLIACLISSSCGLPHMPSSTASKLPQASLENIYSGRPKSLPALRVSENGRFLINEDGAPFFYLADTAWTIVNQTNADQVDIYLQNRARKRFTVIQFVAAMNLHTAFVNGEIRSPIDSYWWKVDSIINKAEALGLYLGLVPVWGDAVTSGQVTIANAYAYGEFLGARYRTHPIVWILGGDKGAGGYEDVWRALAKGLAIGVAGTEDYSAVLMSYHPTFRQSSSEWFHGDAWLGFNMIQSGHCQDHVNYKAIQADYMLRPVKPTMEGEAVYENIPDCLTRGKPKATDHDVRRAAYRSVFAGGHGFTYGANEVYGFWDRGETGFGYATWGADTPWRQALDLPGAFQMRYLRSLMESRPYLVRIPDQSLVGFQDSINERAQATRAADGSYAFIYVSDGEPVSVDMTKISGEHVQGWWYNPKEGTSRSVGVFPNSGIRTFFPLMSGVGSDWVLVLDDASREFAPPGMLSIAGRVASDG